MIVRTTGRRGMPASVACAGLLVVWLAGCAPAAQDTKPVIEKGQRAFTDNGCYGCHTVGKFGTQGIAADLSLIGAKYDRAYLAKWLADPAAQRPTAHMPKIQMGEADADALAAYLSSLR